MSTNKHFHERKLVARRLRKLRTRLGLPQRELASRLGFAHPCSISSIEKARRPLYANEVDAFAEALGCEVDDILGSANRRSTQYPVPRRMWFMALAGTMILFSQSVGVAWAIDGADGIPDGHVADVERNDDLSGHDDDGGLVRPRQHLFPLIESDNCDPTGSAMDGHIGS